MLISDFFQLVVGNVCAFTMIMWPRFNKTKSENNRLPDYFSSINYGNNDEKTKKIKM